MGLFGADAQALGLGRVSVQSTLGEPLRAEVDVTSLSPDEAANLSTALASPDAFRAAGLDFNAALTGAKTALARRPDNRPYIKITGERSVNEPFLDIVLEFTTNGGRLQRSYTLLIDPSSRTERPGVVATATVLSDTPGARPEQAAPTPTPTPASTPEPSPATTAVAEPARPSRPTRPPPRAAGPAAAASAAPAPKDGTYTVRRGDSLSQIARRESIDGVSLDQMLVSLYRGNPQAFSGDNMNRLKAGAVIKLSGAEAAQTTPDTEARQIVRAQSADFDAYRRRLAGAVPTRPGVQPTRKASGRVEAAVSDKKADAMPEAPDKLTLSSGGARPGSPEAALAKEGERQAAARVAELTRNVDELKRLASAASSAQAANLPGTEVASASSPATTLAPLPLPGASAAPAEAATASAPAVPAPASAAGSTAAPALAASQARAPASAASAASAPPMPEPSPSGQPAWLQMLAGNPVLLGAAAGVLALLGALLAMRRRRQSEQAASETSFMESRQPDSFFGASGGQRVDTQESGKPTGSSLSATSLSYSLSQLDAIGDVDPVAEADVYLAYGRDLQAEEILKEALRSDPKRLGLRTKLLEVYAKRADTQSFETQARQVLDMTEGEGEDWARAQALGLQIDPTNPLYGAAELTEPALPRSLPAFDPTADQGIDVDIDPSPLVAPTPAPADDPFLADFPEQAPAAPPARASEEPVISLSDALPGTLSSTPSFEASSFDPPASPAAGAAAKEAPPPDHIDFDFGDLSLDLDPKAPAATVVDDDVPDLSVADSGLPIDDADPLGRKLELAEEFRLIGDVEGARDLLEEVIAKADEPLKAKARRLLSDLG
jgi:pilus assembly protein FimV